VFMTRSDILHCVHEPFGDAFYYGPERLSERYDKDEAARVKSGFAETTYKDVLDNLLGLAESQSPKRLFIKDIAHYLLPPHSQPATIAPSLASQKQNGNSTTTTPSSSDPKLPNPTVLPTHALANFHFTFLIRHPRRAVPSYYRCTIPPLREMTGFDTFMPSEAGYDELRRLFDFLRDQGMIVDDNDQQQQQAQQQQQGQNGHATSNGTLNGAVNGHHHPGQQDKPSITVIDADDLLDDPEAVVAAYCARVGIDYQPRMLSWGQGPDARREADRQFDKWRGFHEDAIGSAGLVGRGRGAKKNPTPEQEDAEWRAKYGDEAQKVIRACVDANVPDYEYLKTFALRV